MKQVSQQRTEVLILATRTQDILGEKGQRITELTSLIQTRYEFHSSFIQILSFLTSPFLVFVLFIY